MTSLDEVAVRDQCAQMRAESDRLVEMAKDAASPYDFMDNLERAARLTTCADHLENRARTALTQDDGL